MIHKSKLTPETVVLDSDDLIFFDVDETLVFWRTDEDPSDVIIQAIDVYLDDKVINLVPHERNIALLKRNFGQGRTIVVWSMGGALWAESVVKALGLEGYVSLIMSKPKMYCDDIDMKDWGCSRMYLKKHLPKHPV